MMLGGQQNLWGMVWTFVCHSLAAWWDTRRMRVECHFMRQRKLGNFNGWEKRLSFFLLLFLLLDVAKYNFSVFPSFLLHSVCLCVRFPSFMSTVRVQRSSRQLAWETCGSNNGNFLTYQPYNTYHPGQCRMETSKCQKPSPQNNLRNVLDFFPPVLLTIYFLFCVPFACVNATNKSKWLAVINV